MAFPEVMAPVGTFESLAAAINAGCDSIYFGVTQLNMRARAANNFNLNDLREIAERCHEAKINSYLALNTIMYQHDLTLMRKIIEAAHESGITAIIAADVAAIQYCNQVGISCHASTQLSISNLEGVKFYSKFCDTIVLAREVDLDTMKTICQAIKAEDIRGPKGQLVKIEVFVHGALCIAPAGRCNMSILQTNTSAQRGACLQECRKKYRIIEEETGREMRVENEYILSPKDLCCIDFLDKILDAGITILKLEGRGRSAQYVDTVVSCYREAVDSIKEGTYNESKIEAWLARLKTVYNRGFTDGYYLGKQLPDWSGHPGNRATKQRVFLGLVNHYFPKNNIAELKLQAHPLNVNDEIVIMGKTTGVIETTVESIWLDDQPTTTADHPNMVTIPIPNRVRKNDQIYILKQRQLDQ